MEHCLCRLSEATFIDPTMVTTLDQNLRFQVTSTSDPKKSYHVDMTKPTCECFDFHVHFMPCKHILAIFTLEKSTIHLCSQYLKSKYFNINQPFLDWINETNSEICPTLSDPLIGVKGAEKMAEECVDHGTMSQSGTPYISRSRANKALNRLKNFINNTANKSAVDDAIVFINDIYSKMQQRYGEPTAFAKRRGGKYGLTVRVPFSFLKRKIKNRKRLQKRKEGKNEHCNKSNINAKDMNC